MHYAGELTDASEITALRCIACFLCPKSKKTKGASQSSKEGTSAADRYIDIPFFVVEAPVSSRML